MGIAANLVDMPVNEGIDPHQCWECGRLVKHDWRLHCRLHEYFRAEEARGHGAVPVDL